MYLLHILTTYGYTNDASLFDVKYKDTFSAAQKLLKELNAQIKENEYYVR